MAGSFPPAYPSFCPRRCGGSCRCRCGSSSRCRNWRRRSFNGLKSSDLVARTIGGIVFDRDLDAQVTAQKLVGVLKFLKANGTHHFAQLLPTDFFSFRVWVAGVQVGEHHAPLMLRSGDVKPDRNIFSRPGLRVAKLCVSDGGRIPSGRDRIKVTLLCFWNVVDVKCFAKKTQSLYS